MPTAPGNDDSRDVFAAPLKHRRPEVRGGQQLYLVVDHAVLPTELVGAIATVYDQPPQRVFGRGHHEP
jgi:hypothetical protein